MTGNLRSVRPGETAPTPAKRLTLAEAVAAGDYLAELEALHRRVSAVVDANSTSPRDLAPLMRRQVELSREIQTLRMQRGDEAAPAVEDGVFDAGAV